MHVVTSGWPYLDIDAYGAAVAMAELLRLQGEDAVAASSAPFNASVPESLRTLDVQLLRDYKPTPNDTFAMVDISNAEYFDFHIPADRVSTVIDHRVDFQDVWAKRLGDRAHIEFIGAACTLIYELWQQAGLFNKMSQDSAKLLACGILDNTLDLKASITTVRDKIAYDNLTKHAGLPVNLPEQYFEECQAYTARNLDDALRNDGKPTDYPSRYAYVGQLTLWNAEKLLNSRHEDIVKIMDNLGEPWYINFINIETNSSIIFCRDIDLQRWIANTIDVTFKGDRATANRMWLRKEIMKQAIERSES